MHTRLRHIISLAAAGLFGWLTVRDVAWDDLALGFASIPLWVPVAALIALILGYATRILRWWQMLRLFRPTLNYGAVVGPFVAAFALNNVAPLRTGDVVRVFAFCDRLGVRPAQVAGTVIVERVLDLLALIAFLTAGLTLLDLDDIGPELRGLVVGTLITSFIATVAVMLAPRAMAKLALRINRLRSIRQSEFARKIMRFGIRTLHAISAIMTPHMTVRLIPLSLLTWAFEGALFYAVAVGLGMQSVGGAWLALPTATLMTLIPGTPGHVGTFDFGAKLGFMAFNAGPAQATLAALIIHAAIWLPITLVGALWLARVWGGSALGRARQASFGAGFKQ